MKIIGLIGLLIVLAGCSNNGGTSHIVNGPKGIVPITSQH